MSNTENSGQWSVVSGQSRLPLHSVLVALGSNAGDRIYHLGRAIEEMGPVVRVVRISTVHETQPVDAPPGSPNFFNLVIAGYTRLGPRQLLDGLLAIEKKLGRVRRGLNAPRTIDLDLILHSAHVMKTNDLTLPHPRYLDRTFVMDPIRELQLAWVDPLSGRRIDAPASASRSTEFRSRGRLQPALSFREALLYFLTRGVIPGSGRRASRFLNGS